MHSVVNRAIIDELHYAGSYGVLPRGIAARLKEYNLKPWNVTQRIRRMNNKLDSLIGQKVAEERGKGWALQHSYEKHGVQQKKRY